MIHAFLAILCIAFSAFGFAKGVPAFGLIWALLAFAQAIAFGLVSKASG
jgi:hypothetical protein